MAFYEGRLDPCYSFGATGGPMFSTEVAKTVSGQRYANRNWLYPLGAWDISSAIKTEADFESIRALFYVVFGRADGFRFKDWTDYRTTAAPLSLVTGSTYQLLKRYTHGSRTFDRPIYKPVSGKVTVYRNGGAIAPTFDYTTGRVTVSGHTPGDVYTWTGEFDVPVAFVNDRMEVEVVNKGKNGLFTRWPNIQLEEIRPPA